MWNFDYLDALKRTSLQTARLYTTERRDGVSLLFVHGGFHGAWCWAPFLQFFAENGIGCGAVDLRGHGGQKQPDDFLRQGAADMATDVKEAASVMGGEIVLVGHSTGAMAAMLAAQSLNPCGLILIAPAAPANVATKPVLPTFAADQAITIPGEERFRKWFLQGTGNDTNIAPVLSRLCPESPAFMNDCFTAGISIELESIKCPTFCVSGARDVSPLHVRAQDQAVASLLNADIEIIPDAGHSMMIEPLWRAGAVAILDWLRRTDVIAI